MKKNGANIDVWITKSACSGTDPDLWFVDHMPPYIIETLRNICVDCPVINECRTYATSNDLQGFWGGLTMAERNRLKRNTGNPQ